MTLHVQMDLSLSDHPRTSRLARALGLDIYAAEGLLFRLWGRWGLQHARGEVVPEAEPEDLESPVGWRGETGKLAAALVSTGWVEAREGGVWLRGFERYSVLQAKVDRRRDYDRERNQRRRQKISDIPSVGEDPLLSETNGKPDGLTCESHVNPEGLTCEPGVSPDEPNVIHRHKKEKEKEKENIKTTPRARMRSKQDADLEEVARVWNAAAEDAGLRGCRFDGRGDVLTDNAEIVTYDITSRVLCPERGLEWWRSYVDRVASSDWCRGQIDNPGCHPWGIRKALEPSVIARVQSGTYDNRPEAGSASEPRRRPSVAEQCWTEAAELRRLADEAEQGLGEDIDAQLVLMDGGGSEAA